jgi:hypothetical protein
MSVWYNKLRRNFMASTLKQTTSKHPAFAGSIAQEIRIEPTKATGLNDMFDQLDLLMKSGDYDDDFLSPTASAADRMRGLLEKSSVLLKIALPIGTLYADGDGGLRLEWIRPDRELRLVIAASPEGRNYIYHEDGSNHGADYSPNVDKLSQWLNWLGN